MVAPTSSGSTPPLQPLPPIHPPSRVSEAALRVLLALQPADQLNQQLRSLIDKELSGEELQDIVGHVAERIHLYMKGGATSTIDTILRALEKHPALYDATCAALIGKAIGTTGSSAFIAHQPDQAASETLKLVLGAHDTAGTAFTMLAHLVEARPALRSHIPQGSVEDQLLQLHAALHAPGGQPLSIATTTAYIAAAARLLANQITPREFLDTVKNPDHRPHFVRLLAHHIGQQQAQLPTIAQHLFFHNLYSINDPTLKSALGMDWSADSAAQELLQVIGLCEGKAPVNDTDFLQLARYAIANRHILDCLPEDLADILNDVIRTYEALKADSKPEENMSDLALQQTAIAITYFLLTDRTDITHATKEAPYTKKHHTLKWIELPRTMRIFSDGDGFRVRILHQSKGLPFPWLHTVAGRRRVGVQTADFGGTTKATWTTELFIPLGSAQLTTSGRMHTRFINKEAANRNDAYPVRGTVFWRLTQIDLQERAQLMAGFGRALRIQCLNQGIVHCDLKPANILRMPDGSVLIIDFQYRSHVGDWIGPTGTGPYIPPDKLEATIRPSKSRDDAFAVAPILLEMMGHHIPWAADATTFSEAYWYTKNPDPALIPRIKQQIGQCRDQCRVTAANFHEGSLERAWYTLAADCLEEQRPELAVVCARLEALGMLPPSSNVSPTPSAPPIPSSPSQPASPDSGDSVDIKNNT